MSTRICFSALASIMRFALVLVVGAALAVPNPAAGASPLGADLGIASGFKILDGASCGQYMTTAALDSQCDTANTNHWIVLGWNFDPNACATKPCAKPDGFNIVRAINGTKTTFATQAASANQSTVFGTILQNIKGDENIGACFSVVPYRGTDDFGRASNEVCIIQTEHLEIGPTHWGTAHSYSHRDDNGIPCSSPRSNPEGYKLMFMGNGANSGTSIFAGYVVRSDQGCNSYEDFYQALVYYDLSKLAGKTVTKATLKLEVVASGYNPGGVGGGPNMNGAESTVTRNCATRVGFPTNVNVGSDTTYPAVINYDRFATINDTAAEVDLDVTGMVLAWQHPGGVNRGIVLTPAVASPAEEQNFAFYSNPKGTIFNFDCLSQYREPVLVVDAR